MTARLLRLSLDAAAWGCISVLVVIAALAQHTQPRRDVARDVGGLP